MQNVKLLSLFIGAFLIFNFAFYIQPVNAQACPPGLASCAGACVASSPASACTATDGSGRVGTLNECGVCSNLACPGGQTLCAGVCRVNADGCPGGSNRTYSACDGCDGCSAGFTDCDIGAGFNCQALTSPACPAPRTYDPCTGACTDPYVIVNPGAPQTGFFNITGTGTIGTDLWVTGGNVYLGSGRAIRVDANGATTLNIGNYDAGANDNDHFQLRLHAPDAAISELLFHQGGDDRWAISLRTPSRNLEFWRKNVEWAAAPTLTLDFTNGRVGIATATPGYPFDVIGDVRFSGTLQGGLVPWARLTGLPAACPAGPPQQFVTAVGGTLVCAAPATGAGSITGNGTTNVLAKFIGASSIGDSLISETGSAVTVSGTLKVGADGPVLTGLSTGLTVGGNLSGTGCFGPTFVGVTGTAVDGNRGGYTAVHTACASAYPAAGAAPAAHGCATAEILESIRCSAAGSSIFMQTGFAWINNGPPGFLANANDCIGWTWTPASGVAYGAMWEFSDIGGSGSLTTCDTQRVIACCR